MKLGRRLIFTFFEHFMSGKYCSSVVIKSIKCIYQRISLISAFNKLYNCKFLFGIDQLVNPILSASDNAEEPDSNRES